jgi:hypothetical protein
VVYAFSEEIIVLRIINKARASGNQLSVLVHVDDLITSILLIAVVAKVDDLDRVGSPWKWIKCCFR